MYIRKCKNSIRGGMALLLMLLFTGLLFPAPGHSQKLPPVVAVSAGGDHTLVIRDNNREGGLDGGTVWAFGANSYGQLGNGNKVSGAIPVQVRDPGGYGYLSKIVAIAAGERHSVALDADGVVWTWGANNRGQLGIGKSEDKTTPVRVRFNLTENDTIVNIAAGHQHSVALTRNGDVYSWGANESGQLGNSNTRDQDVPQKVYGLGGVRAVAAGDKHTAVMTQDQVYCWGDNSFGQLGDGSNTSSSMPVSVQQRISGMLQAIAKTSVTLDVNASSVTGNYNGLNITVIGDWEDDWDGVGVIKSYNGSTKKATVTFNQTPPKFEKDGTYKYVIDTVSNLDAIICGKHHTLALTQDGAAWGWGANSYGQLGNKGTVDANQPTRVAMDDPTKAMAAGDWHSVILKNDGTVWTFGRNNNLQLGSNSRNIANPTLTQIKDLAAGLYVAAGGTHSLALMPDGKLYGWGSYQYGQIGRSVNSNVSVPVLIDTTPPMSNQPPTIINTSPKPDDDNVVISTAIRITCSEPIHPGPYWDNITLMDVTFPFNPIGPIAVQNPNIQPDSVLNIVPVLPLDPERVYRVYIPAQAVQDDDGYPLKDSYEFKFTTIDSLQPYIVNTIPNFGQTGVGRSSVIQAMFSRNMDAATINQNTFLVREKNNHSNIIDGVVSYNAATRTATFEPFKKLDHDVEYEVILTNIIADEAGTPMSGQYDFEFQVAPDTEPPQVVGHYPAANENRVPLQKQIVITYDEDFFLSNPNIITLTNLTTGVAINIQIDRQDNKMIITPQVTLDPGVTYEVRVGAGAVIDSAGNSPPFDFSFKFTTTTDFIPPRVISSTPIAHATGVAVMGPGINVLLTFSEDVQEGAGMWDAITLKTGNNQPVPITKTIINSNMLMVLPNQDLDILTDYILTIPAAAVMDLSENIMANDYLLPFKTGSIVPGAKLSIPRDLYVRPGYEIEVPVLIEDAHGLTGFQFDLEYDGGILQLPVGVIPGGGLSWGWNFQFHDISPPSAPGQPIVGRVRVEGHRSQGDELRDNGEKELVKVKFLVDNAAREGDTPIGFGKAAQPKLDGVDKVVNTRDGKITVIKRKLGDINGDDVVDVQDIMDAVRFVLNEASPSSLEKFMADINRDGEIDILDVVEIVNLSLGR